MWYDVHFKKVHWKWQVFGRSLALEARLQVAPGVRPNPQDGAASNNFCLSQQTTSHREEQKWKRLLRT